MANGLIQQLDNLANSINAQSGTTAGMTIEEMNTAVEENNSEIETQTDLIVQIQAALIGKAAGGGSGITFDDIATLALKGEVYLTSTTVQAYALANNDGITSIYAPNVTSIGNYAFNSSNGVKTIYFPSLKTVGQNCLSNLAITTLDLPECTTIGASSFNQCTKITSINLPKATAIPNSCLSGTLAKTIVLPEATSIGNSSLSNSINLTYVDLPKCTSLVNYALRNSSKLATLILRSETMCTLSNYALNSTPIFNGTGYVYVPSALIASYQVATNWKTAYGKNNNVFRALEDYTVDGTITGELDATKI